MAGVICKRCGHVFMSEKMLRQITKIISERNLERFQDSFMLCQTCRRETFAHQLIGSRLEKVDRAPYVTKRRSVKIKPVKVDIKTGATIYKSECFICNTACDSSVWVEDGKVTKVEGDLSSPVTKGTLCAKGLASTNLLYHPNRLKYPMKRNGERGNGKWQRISWDEALDAIANRFMAIEQKYGKDSIVCSQGTSRGWLFYFARFASAWGKQFTGPGMAQCATPRKTGQRLVLGGDPLECPDFSSTRSMIVWGVNPVATWHWKGLGMMEAWARGAKLIAVDPVFSETASKADIWLRLRPGTDSALALAMLNVIINEKLYDKEFVERWCLGFDELKERVQEYPPGEVEEITWVPRAKIIESARLYATTKPASITQGLAIDQNADTISTSRSIAMLAALTGNIDVPGGNVFLMHLPVYRVTDPEHILTNLWSKDQIARRLGAREYPFLAGEESHFPSAHNATLWKAILTGKPYPVRAMYNHGNNMLVAYPNTNVVRKALLSLDFLVVTDLFLTPTAEIADIVIPAASWMERSMVNASDQMSLNNVHLQQKAVELDECWSDYKILNELAKRLGFGELMFDSEEGYYDFILKPSGMTWREFKKKGIITVPMTYRKYEENGFKTPSGRVELYSQKLKNLGFDPLPGYREPTESPVSNPELAREYPLILTTGGREPVFRHSELRNIPVLRQIWPEPRAKINPKTGYDLDIRDGDSVIVETLRGRLKAKAWLREDIDPRVVQVPSHWPGENNANLLTDNENCAPMVGGAQLRCQLCRIKKE
ncbi:molybdopterin-dependent oxidoreductase [Chloroflexota bacterium]